MSLWSRLFSRRKRMMEALEQDIRDFIERETQDNIERGMSPEEARYAALRKFGNVTRVKEEAREVWSFCWLEQLWQDVRFGLRTLRKSLGFTCVAILTLALGIGANTAIFSLIDSVMLKMLPVERPDQLLQVQMRDPRWGDRAGGTFTNPLWEQVRDHQDVFSSAFAWGEDRFDLAQGGPVRLVNGLWVSGEFFDTLRLRPSAGRLIVASDDWRGCTGVAVLSYGFWQEHYGGDVRAIGSTLTLSGHSVEVIGVAPRGFYGMEVGEKFDVAVPVCFTAFFDGRESRLDARDWWWLRVAGRMKDGMEVGRAKTRLAAISRTVFMGALPQRWSSESQKGFLKRTLTGAWAQTGPISDVRHQFEQPLDILMAVVGLVLLIACANIASLMLARGAARHKEIAVRQALGARRARLIGQLLTESILLSTAGALLGILFARWGASLLVGYMSTARDAVFLDLSLDGRVLAFTVATAVLTGVLFGLLPALWSTRVPLISAMKGTQAIDDGRRVGLHARKWIVAAQIAFSLVLLVAAGLLLRSFAKLATLDIGFDRDNVLLVRADLRVAKVPADQQIALFENIENRLRALPGVISAGRSLISPIEGGGWSQTIRTDSPVPQAGVDTETWLNCVSPGHFQTLRMRLLAGRNFTSADIRTAPAVAIVNQTFARRFFAGLSPLGRTFRLESSSGQFGPPIQIVGLMNDSKYESVREETHPTAFFPATQAGEHFRGEIFELRTAIPPSALVGPIQAAVAPVNKEIPLDFRTLADQVNDSMVQERLLALLSGFFGALALLLAVIGLYGTLSYLVTQRQAEFGIRMALGAMPGSILGLVARDLGAVLAGGLTAGILISLAATRVLQQMLFGLGPRDTATMLLAAGALTAVALLAGYVPARRATKVDPMGALRYE